MFPRRTNTLGEVNPMPLPFPLAARAYTYNMYVRRFGSRTHGMNSTPWSIRITPSTSTSFHRHRFGCGIHRRADRGRQNSVRAGQPHSRRFLHCNPESHGERPDNTRAWQPWREPLIGMRMRVSIFERSPTIATSFELLTEAGF